MHRLIGPPGTGRRGPPTVEAVSSLTTSITAVTSSWQTVVCGAVDSQRHGFLCAATAYPPANVRREQRRTYQQPKHRRNAPFVEAYSKVFKNVGLSPTIGRFAGLGRFPPFDHSNGNEIGLGNGKLAKPIRT